MGDPVSEWSNRELSSGRYLVFKTEGEGGMGAVYRAHDRNLGTDVVIKVPHRRLLTEPGFADRFTSEIRSLVNLSHPHIVKITDVGDANGVPFAVMQFLDGGDLEDRFIGENGRPKANSLGSLSTWLPDIARTLDFMHSQGYVHRDVKPGNILFDRHNNAFLSDFGIAKALANSSPTDSTQGLTGTGMVLGTADYMAPELIMGKTYDGRVDQYALAVAVFELLAGRRPFEAETATAVMVKQSTQQPPSLAKFRPDIPKSVCDAVAQGLSKDPRHRFDSCEAFALAVMAGHGDMAFSSKKKEGLETLPCPNCQINVQVDSASVGTRMRCSTCSTNYVLERMGADLRLIPVVSRVDASLQSSTGENRTRKSPPRSSHPSAQSAANKTALAVENKPASADSSIVRTKRITGCAQTNTNRVEQVHVQTAATKVKAVRKPTKPKLLIGAGLAVVFLVMSSAAIATIYFATNYGTVEINILDKNAKTTVSMDGELIEVTGIGKPLRVSVGEHHLKIESPDFVTESTSFTLRRGEKKVLNIRLSPDVASSNEPGERNIRAALEPSPSTATFPTSKQVYSISFNLHDDHRKYLHATSAAEVHSERKSQGRKLHYWAPNKEATWGSVTYKFEVPFPINTASLQVVMGAYSGGGGEPTFDSNAEIHIDVSGDGQQWHSVSSMTPGKGGLEVRTLDISRPLLNSSNVFVRARMYLSKTNQFFRASQFLRTAPNTTSVADGGQATFEFVATGRESEATELAAEEPVPAAVSRSQSLLDAATAIENNPKHRQIQLKQASELAVQDGNVSVVLKAAEELARLDNSDPLNSQFDALSQLSRARSDSGTLSAIGSSCLRMSRDAETAGNLSLAIKFVELGIGCARDAENHDLAREASLRYLDLNKK